MRLTVLSVAFPFAPVSAESVGGAEQILSHLDAALVAEGHTSVVVACEGSRPAGTLVSFPLPPQATLSDADQALSTIQVQHAINRALAAHRVDLIHLHGLDLENYALPPDVPVLVTLHLPIAWYSPEVWRKYARRARFCCVSEAQRESLPLQVRDAVVIENGVPLQPFDPHHENSDFEKADFALVLGRVCPEKNAHAAFEAGTRAGIRVLLGGEVFPYAGHQKYFRDCIEPRVAPHAEHPRHEFLGRLQHDRKLQLLRQARCLLHPTLAPETSSLVAMEALAAGTPVIAFRSGALPQIVEDGVTGFLVDSVEEMAEALRHVHKLSPLHCRRAAEQRFALNRMVREYFLLYAAIAHRQPLEALYA
jgi:glycosyltransferase involved in cell wall biosynthesis